MNPVMLEIFQKPATAVGSIFSAAFTGTFAILNSIESWVGILALILACFASFFTALAMYESWRDKRNNRKK